MVNLCAALLVAGTLLATATASATSRLRDESCSALPYLPTRTQVERCVSSVVVPRARMLAMVDLASNATVLYPYTQILKDANATSYYYPRPVDLERELDTLAYDVAVATGSSGSDKEEDTVPFFEFYSRLTRVVASARDGHLDVRVSSPADEPGVVVDYVGAVLPFALQLYGDHARVAPSAATRLGSAVDEATVARERGVEVAAIDGLAPGAWVAAVFGAFNPMKSAQGRFVYMHRALNAGIMLATAPDKETLFSKHVLTYSDGTHLPFEFVFVNTRKKADSGASARAAEAEAELPFMKMQQRPGEHGPLTEDEVVTMIERKAREYAHGSGTSKGTRDAEKEAAIIAAARKKSKLGSLGIDTNSNKGNNKDSKGKDGFEAATEDGSLYCRVVEGFADYVAVPTFSPESVDAFLDVLLRCAGAFDANALPVVVDVGANGGGYLALAAATFMVLSPYADARAMVAVRAGAYTPAVVAQAGMGEDRATCAPLTSTGAGTWYRDAVRVVYAGGTRDTRSQTEYLSFEALRPALAPYALARHPRAQTEVLVLTDGYCFSACAFLLSQLRETHSALAVGYDAAPLRAPFDAAQCASSVVAPAGAVPALRRLAEAAGAALRTPFWQSFPLDYTFRAVVPHDFLPAPVDTAVDYYTDDPAADATVLAARLSGVLAEYNASCRAGYYLRSACRDEAVLGREGQGVVTCDPATNTWRTDSCVLLYCNSGYFYNSTSKECEVDVCAALSDDDDENGGARRAAGSRSAGTIATLTVTAISVFVSVLLCSVVTFLISFLPS